MNEFKTAALTTLSLMMTAPVFASEVTTIDLSANVPAESFHFRPITTVTSAQNFDWDLLNEELKPISIDFSYNKGASDSAVTAQLTSAVKLTNGGDVIDVNTSVGGVPVTETAAATVVLEADAQNGSKALVLTPNVTGRANAGQYVGTVELTFNAVPQS